MGPEIKNRCVPMEEAAAICKARFPARLRGDTCYQVAQCAACGA